MTPTSEPAPPVGQQLRERREQLDLTQEALARRIGIATPTVSVTERGHTEISRGKRPAWERALQLKPGTLSRAYKEGTPLEPADTNAAEQPYPDLADEAERGIWELPMPEEERRVLIHYLRKHRQQQANNQARPA